MNTSIIAYCCSLRPTQNNQSLGGGIDIKTRAIFTELAAASAIEVISSSAMDTQSCTVVGRLTATGPIVSITVILTGTIAKPVGVTFNRILSVQLGSNAVGTVTVRKASAGSTIKTIPAGERGFSALFINSGFNRDSQVVYDKFFWKNSTGLTITVVQADLTVDAIGRMKIALADALDDSDEVATRLNAPTHITAAGFVGIGTLLDSPDDLEDGNPIGVWVQQTIPAGGDAELSTFTARIGGISST